MTLATTQQFRNAVRKVCSKYGVTLGSSWTNGSPAARYPSLDRALRGSPGVRTVGFALYFCGNATKPSKLVKKVEARLMKEGFGTADTRFTTSDEYRAGSYLRGTCRYSPK